MFPVKMFLAVAALIALTVLMMNFTTDETEKNEQALLHVLDLMEESLEEAGTVPGRLQEEEAEAIQAVRRETTGLLKGFRCGSVEMGFQEAENAFWYYSPYVESDCVAEGQGVEAAFVGIDTVLAWNDETYAVYTLHRAEVPLFILSDVIEEAEYPWAARWSVSTEEEAFAVAAEFTENEDGSWLVTAKYQTKKGRFKSMNVTILGWTAEHWSVGDEESTGERFLCFRGHEMVGIHTAAPAL